jgi:FkbM family methyltransferase
MSISEFIYTVLLKPAPLRKVANFAITSIIPNSIKVKGAIIHLNPSDPVVSGALTLKSYENDEIEFFTKRFTQGMTFVDVGANVGLYTGMAIHKSPVDSVIICIEPDARSRHYLIQTIQSNRATEQQSTVCICPVAASDSKGDLILYKNSQNKGDNRIYADPLCDETETIESDTLDNLCRIHRLDSIDFLKVDVQGAEHKVFSGGKLILSKSSDCILMTEFWPYGLTNCGSSPEEYLSLLQNLGFSLYELDRHILIPILDFKYLISRCPGRVYKNLIGLKGKYKQ